MSHASEPCVILEVRHRTLVVTLNRPDARNAVNAAMARGVADALDQLDADRNLVVGVMTGAGGTFSAGMDLRAFVAGELPIVEGRGFAGLTRRPPRKPLIAAVDGHALAGGMEIALACDLIVANRDARFGLPEVKRGLVAAGGGLLRLPRQMPYRIALEYALTGDILTAGRALELGLVNRLTDGPALEAALPLAEMIGRNSPMAVAATKRIMEGSRLWEDGDMWDRQKEIADPVFASSDAREGSLAFSEKREPVWTGS